MLMAIANQQVGLQAIHEMITGCMLSGRPVANAIYNAIAQMGMTSAVAFAGDMKLRHYRKVPPRIMFSVQIVATTIGCILVTLVQD